MPKLVFEAPTALHLLGDVRAFILAMEMDGSDQLDASDVRDPNHGAAVQIGAARVDPPVMPDTPDLTLPLPGPPVDDDAPPLSPVAAVAPVGGPAGPFNPDGSPTLLEGVPWDTRIHAANKGKVRKDTGWRLLKGVDKAVLESVTAELKAQYGATYPIATEPVAPAVAGAVATTAAAGVPVNVAEPMALASRIIGTFTDEASLLRIGDNITAVMNKHGVNDATELFHKPELVHAVMVDLRALAATMGLE